MKLKIKYFNDIYIRFHKTALYLAVEKENVEIIKLLLSNNELDINCKVLNQLYSLYLYQIFK